MPSKKTNKRHSLNQSQLYRILGKGRFREALGVSFDATASLFREENYNAFKAGKQKKRDIQEPVDPLAPLHRRIGKLLSLIEVPHYVYAQPGRSCIDNALQHVGEKPSLKIDIKRFFRSTKRRMVYRMFANDFKCAQDIASRLADLCCYRQEFLPTGSPLSGFIAFFAAKNMFDELAEFASSKQCTMTLYVDDIIFSGENAVKEMLGEIYRIIDKHGYTVNRKKTKAHAPYSAKTVTGIIVCGNQIRLPHRRHKKILEAKRALTKAIPGGDEYVKLEQKLRGRREEARRILEASQALTRQGTL